MSLSCLLHEDPFRAGIRSCDALWESWTLSQIRGRCLFGQGSSLAGDPRCRGFAFDEILRFVLSKCLLDGAGDTKRERFR